MSLFLWYLCMESGPYLGRCQAHWSLQSHPDTCIWNLPPQSNTLHWGHSLPRTHCPLCHSRWENKIIFHLRNWLMYFDWIQSVLTMWLKPTAFREQSQLLLQVWGSVESVTIHLSHPHSLHGTYWKSEAPVWRPHSSDSPELTQHQLCGILCLPNCSTW